jgi:hypothetical protein
MVLDAERIILVVDRTGKIDAEQGAMLEAKMRETAERLGMSGAVVLPFEVDLGDDDAEGIAHLAGAEIDALRWVIGFVRTQPTASGREHAATLTQMLDRLGYAPGSRS